MNFKDNPNYVTTKEVSDALRCGRTNVQKLEALGKLNRVGVEGNRVYYSRSDVEALADDKTYGAVPTTKSDELPPPYYADGYSPDAEYRRWERSMMQRYEAPRQQVQPDATGGIQRQLERIGNELADHAREQRELRQREQEKTVDRGVNWYAVFGIGALGLVAWACFVELRKQKESAQAERDREVELEFRLLLKKGTAADLDEYLALPMEKGVSVLAPVGGRPLVHPPYVPAQGDGPTRVGAKGKQRERGNGEERGGRGDGVRFYSAQNFPVIVSGRVGQHLVPAHGRHDVHARRSGNGL
jgi:hypothetical protein